MPRQATHTCNKEAEIAVMQTDIVYIKEMVTDTNHKLLGNGKPGILAEQAARITALEQKMWKFMGAVAVITFLLSLIIPKVVNALLG